MPCRPLLRAGPSVGSLIRSGMSVGSNYRAACRGRSKREFIAKLGTVEEEADESAYWLELISEGQLLKNEQVESLLQEAAESAKIMASSQMTAKANSESQIANCKSEML